MRGILPEPPFGFRADGVVIFAFPAERAIAIGITVNDPLSPARVNGVPNHSEL
jgi:hypothetical protein